MDDNCRILTRLDDFIEITYCSMPNCHGERTIVPNGALSIQEIAPHQVRSRHVLVASDRYQRPLEEEGHVLDESGLARPGRTLEHDRHTLSVSRFEQPDFIAYG